MNKLRKKRTADSINNYRGTLFISQTVLDSKRTGRIGIVVQTRKSQFGMIPDGVTKLVTLWIFVDSDPQRLEQVSRIDITALIRELYLLFVGARIL